MAISLIGICGALGGAWLTACSTQGAADDSQASPLRKVAEVVADDFEGPARVELHVDGWVEYRGISAGDREHQTCILAENAPDRQRLDVLIAPEVFDRLRSLGIANPREHFVGKRVVVSGTVHCNDTPSGAVSVIMWIDDLAQIESITEPEKE
jgi:hypothetical protein